MSINIEIVPNENKKLKRTVGDVEYGNVCKLEEAYVLKLNTRNGIYLYNLDNLSSTDKKVPIENSTLFAPIDEEYRIVKVLLEKVEK